MITVTEGANEAIKSIMAERSLVAPLRIQLVAGGCGGPQLGLAVSEAKDGDERLDLDGQVYLIDQNLGQRTGGVTVDFIDEDARQGFVITSENQIFQESGCGSCCSCGD